MAIIASSKREFPIGEQRNRLPRPTLFKLAEEAATIITMEVLAELIFRQAETGWQFQFSLVAQQLFRARGGKALSCYGGTKIFAGGGGGAGHANNGFLTAYGGGNGGGIIFIRAKNLIGNNSKITANGQRGGSSIGDGASGGGAGGTVILNIDNYIGTVTIESNGGHGG